MKTTEVGRNIMAKRIAPGIWIDGDGNPHVSLPELMQLFEIEDTPENRELVKERAIAAIRRAAPKGAVIWQPNPPPASNN